MATAKTPKGEFPILCTVVYPDATTTSMRHASWPDLFRWAAEDLEGLYTDTPWEGGRACTPHSPAFIHDDSVDAAMSQMTLGGLRAAGLAFLGR